MVGIEDRERSFSETKASLSKEDWTIPRRIVRLCNREVILDYRKSLRKKQEHPYRLGETIPSLA